MAVTSFERNAFNFMPTSGKAYDPQAGVSTTTPFYNSQFMPSSFGWGPTVSRGGGQSDLTVFANQAATDAERRYRYQGMGGVNQGRSQYAQDIIDAANVPYQYKREVFGQLFPWLQGQVRGSGDIASQVRSIAGTPTIDTNPIWNPQMIQQQVNAGRAQNDQSTQTQQRMASQGVAGRGFGSNSPLAMALQGQLGAQNLATNADLERNTRMTAAQENAKQQLAAQTAWESAYAERQKPWISYLGNQQNALIAAIAGLM